MTAGRLPRTPFVIHNLSGGGAERVLTRLVGALAERDRAWAVDVAVLEPRVVYTLPGGVKLHVLARTVRLTCHATTPSAWQVGHGSTRGRGSC